VTTKAAELGSAQEAFALALKHTIETVASLRAQRRRTTKTTAELPVVEMGMPPPETRGRRPSKIKVSVTGSGSDFQSILLLLNRLKQLSDTGGGEIVCIDENMDFSNGHGRTTSEGVQSFWTRVGKEPPPIRYTSETLEQVLEARPIAILMAPEKAPEEVSGYIVAVLTDPHVCFMLRRD